MKRVEILLPELQSGYLSYWSRETIGRVREAAQTLADELERHGIDPARDFVCRIDRRGSVIYAEQAEA